MTRILTFLIALVILLSITLFNALVRVKELKADRSALQSFYSKAMDSVSVYKNKHGQQVFKNEALILDNRTLRKEVEDGALKFARNLEGVNKRLSNVEYLLSISLSISDSLRTAIKEQSLSYVTPQGDTLLFQSSSFVAEDKYSWFKGVEREPGKLDFTYKVDTGEGIAAMVWKRKVPLLWIFSKKVYSGEIAFENQNVTVPKLVNIKVQKQR